jgi:2-succinyl-5-enolpyruvyl-6-hydroxy-3-cyclohexene-1-carboxylate synthase
MNHNGGGVIGTLEPGGATLAGPYERIFGTPTNTNVSELCAAHHIDHEYVAQADVLADRIAEPGKGIRVCEVPIDRAGQREFRTELAAAATAALASATSSR